MEKIRVTLQLSVLVMGLTLTVIPGCKTATAPQAAECGAGSLPCEDNITECCEVICPELHHHCGDFLTECCLDTTSHDFTWTIDTLGIYGSYLKDVAIIDENNIWAVGNIETDSGEYNAARWNGDQWELQGIYSNTLDLYSIWYFTVDDIWVASHCFPYHWDGNTWTQYHLNNMGMPGICAGNAIWGSSPEDIWFVGDSGSIVHYDGSGFERMESGTDVTLYSISATEYNNVWVSGWVNSNGDYRTVLLHFDGVEWQKKTDYSPPLGQSADPDSLSGLIKGVFSTNQNDIFVSTSKGLYKCHVTTQGEGELIIGSTNFYTSVMNEFDGSGGNDLFAAGSFSKIIHFNGSTFQNYDELYDIGYIYGIDVKENFIVAVGDFSSTTGAMIIRGYR